MFNFCQLQLLYATNDITVFRIPDPNLGMAMARERKINVVGNILHIKKNRS